MEVEIEMTRTLSDVTDIMQKVFKLIDLAKEEGFKIKELEIESGDEIEGEDDDKVVLSSTDIYDVTGINLNHLTV
jgi:hypothetical protein